MRDQSKITKDSFNDLDETEVSAGRRPISAILQEIAVHLTEIVRSEVRLASTEVRHDLTQFAKASVFVVVSAMLGLYSFGLILLAAVYALGETLPFWASALIVAGGVGILGTVFLLIGRKKMKLASLRPDKTIQSLQENATWLKKQTR